MNSPDDRDVPVPDQSFKPQAVDIDRDFEDGEVYPVTNGHNHRPHLDAHYVEDSSSPVPNGNSEVSCQSEEISSTGGVMEDNSVDSLDQEANQNDNGDLNNEENSSEVIQEQHSIYELNEEGVAGVELNADGNYFGGRTEVENSVGEPVEEVNSLPEFIQDSNSSIVIVKNDISEHHEISYVHRTEGLDGVVSEQESSVAITPEEVEPEPCTNILPNDLQPATIEMELESFPKDVELDTGDQLCSVEVESNTQVPDASFTEPSATEEGLNSSITSLSSVDKDTSGLSISSSTDSSTSQDDSATAESKKTSSFHDDVVDNGVTLEEDEGAEERMVFDSTYNGTTEFSRCAQDAENDTSDKNFKDMNEERSKEIDSVGVENHSLESNLGEGDEPAVLTNGDALQQNVLDQDPKESSDFTRSDRVANSPQHRTEPFRLESPQKANEPVTNSSPDENPATQESNLGSSNGKDEPMEEGELDTLELPGNSSFKFYEAGELYDEDERQPESMDVDEVECSKKENTRDCYNSREWEQTGKREDSDDEDPNALTIDEKKPPIKPFTIKIPNQFRKSVEKKSKKGRGKSTSSKPTKKRVQSGDLRCPRCPNVSFSLVSDLLDHQKRCGSISIPQEQPASANVVNTPKQPRKVYMCSACGIHYENISLYQHMKEQHKRLICLHCLAMFSQASKLAQHLASKHKLDMEVQFGAQFSQLYPGSYSFLCARCDVMCNEQTFESHTCSAVCSHCGLAGTHYPTCRLAPPMPPTKPLRGKGSRGPRGPRKPPKEPPRDMLELSPTTYNEKMMQLYRGPKVEKFPTPESIDETINRVLESVASPKREEEDVKTEPAPMPSPPPPSPPPLPAEEEERVPSPVAPVDVSPPPRKRELSESDGSSDSDKLTIELNPRRRRKMPKPAEPTPPPEEEAGLSVAGEEVPFTCVPLPEPLDQARVPTAMKLFLRATSHTCVYCAHARKIAVNSMQLALHQLSQHRYVTIADSSSLAEKIACHASIVRIMREIVPSLEGTFFNAYGFDSSDKSAWRSADRVYECFRCSIITADIREFGAHNKKFHWNDMRQKRIETHLCVMCKSLFLTYTDLLCHLCRGVYVAGQIMDPNSKFRCYCCDIDPLPSSFRLMVHLRSTHITCDMCFTVCDSQTALHAHIMKHKNLFYCYACALTYENRQELQKHIFWKHGAESATCKRCLKKKYRHAYHFCLPPAGFSCDICRQWLKTSVALKVHKRIHSGEKPHSCAQCEEKFISKKLVAKHVLKVHTTVLEQGEIAADSENLAPGGPVAVATLEEGKKKSKKEKKKDLRELFDLPPVNLSESDDSSGDEKKPITPAVLKDEVYEPKHEPEPSSEPQAAPVAWAGVLANLQSTALVSPYASDSPFYMLGPDKVIQIATMDHDYCRPVTTNEEMKAGADHDYCNNSGVTSSGKKHSSPRKPKRRNHSSSSDSSSSSSSSCSCGSNCSCSSSTSSTESATSGDPKNKEEQRKKKLLTKAQRRKTKGTKKEPEEGEKTIEVSDIRVRESDLETEEEFTDDDAFYEMNPALRASEVLQLNRSMLLDKLDAVPSPSTLSTPSYPVRKFKKRKGQPSGSGKMKPLKLYTSSPYTHQTAPDPDSYDSPDPDGRRPRRKRVPLKFYGFSSGDEDYTPPAPRRKEKIVENNTTIPADPVPPEPEASNLWNPPSWREPPQPPKVNPIKIRTGSLKHTFAKSNNSDEFHIKSAELGGFRVNGNGEASREKLYCFCQCPYDEVSEMIACDAVDCAIEWFHFECVGIMDPPKGKWYCPDCRKKAAAESEMMAIPFR